jgi:RNA-directed DNA polymerase
MSQVIVATPRALQPHVTQRHLEAEVAHCVGGVLSPLLANIALSVLDKHFDTQWRALMGTEGRRWRRRRNGLGPGGWSATRTIVRHERDWRLRCRRSR